MPVGFLNFVKKKVLTQADILININKKIVFRFTPLVKYTYNFDNS